MTAAMKKLRALPVAEGLSDESLFALCDRVDYIRLKADEILFRDKAPAEYCYLISYGSLKLKKRAASGRESTMCFCGPGDFVGAAIMLNPNAVYPVTAVGLEDSGLLRIPRSVFLQKWSTNPSMAAKANLNLTRRMMEFHEDKALASASVPQKIAHFLIWTLDGQSPLFGNRIALRLARRDIAERVGTSVETVIRVLSRWTRDGWIRTEDQHIALLQRAPLEKLIRESGADS